MTALICSVLAVLALPFKSKSRLEAKYAVLRHQLIVLRRKVKGRAQPTNNDRWFLVQMYRWFPSILRSLRLSKLKRWCGGIGPAFVAIGVGNRTRGEGAREARRTSFGVRHASTANCSSSGLRLRSQVSLSTW